MSDLDNRTIGLQVDNRFTNIELNNRSINFDFLPKLPNISYYDSNDGNNINSSKTLQNNLQTTCNGMNTAVPTAKFNGIKTYNDLYDQVKKGTNITTTLNTAGVTDPDTQNQIKYLVCQLEKARNREYDSTDNAFKVLGAPNTSLQGVFSQYGGLKTGLILIFLLTMYLLVSGLFSSMDIGGNILRIVEDKSELNLWFFIGLFIGAALPIALVGYYYNNIIQSNLSELEQYEITNNPDGVKSQIDLNAKTADTATLILFVFLIYAFGTVLLTLRSKNFPSLVIYSGVVGLILVILSIFIYLLYAYVPYFDTTDQNQMTSVTPQPLRLFIDNQQTETNIKSNRLHDTKVKLAFQKTFIYILITTIIFIIYNRPGSSFTITNPFYKIIVNFFQGLLSASVVLIIPVIWVFNFVLAINYFYIFPMILLGFRFLRYIGMLIIYNLYNSSDGIQSMVSDDMNDQLNHFENYTPSWNLIGIDILKTLLNFLGYENILSKSIIDDDDESKNISTNKFVFGGIFNFAVNKSKFGITYMILILVLTIIITFSILGGVGVFKDN